MKIGILGTGFGRYHASIYKKLSDVESIIIFGRDKDKLNKIKTELQIEVTDNINDILTNPDIDLVDICLPSNLHRKYVIEALKNGKNVYCETPVSLSLADAIAMKECEKEYGKKVFVDLFIKHEPPYEFLFNLAQKKEYGNLKALYLKRNTPPFWGDLGIGNITTNLMIHEFDFITWLLGSPDNISVSGLPTKEGESIVIANLNYKDTLVQVQSSSMMAKYYPFTVGYEAVFENAVIEFSEKCYEAGSDISCKLYTNSTVMDIELNDKNCYEESIKHVLDCCNKNIPTKLGIDDAIKSLEIAINAKNLLLEKV
ncbi:Gfo/Idh/MocA family protein [Oceanirhabdus seepicola]|uniref:Gfo/Idh/MocA family oxidoreductase n=1 Tax=Oceanirhabdus seepicola TaxID=2828781 RepID=A0A9J6P843_9CLOT|nr:Gfo/Idh/MocA family oxidoreductase [Oceanirhabdus seepicola]MCM1992182.1 Gfo/Idh/MocA family oxidoreductase [Oceanirhabdus seepicola]